MKRFNLVLLLMLILISGCASPANVIPVPMTDPTTSTSTPIPPATFTPTSIATETATLIPTDTPTVTPTLDPIRSTPPTIMLHRSNPPFDSLAFLKDLIILLKRDNLKVLTYRDIYDYMKALPHLLHYMWKR